MAFGDNDNNVISNGNIFSATDVDGNESSYMVVVMMLMISTTKTMMIIIIMQEIMISIHHPHLLARKTA